MEALGEASSHLWKSWRRSFGGTELSKLAIGRVDNCGLLVVVLSGHGGAHRNSNSPHFVVLRPKDFSLAIE